MSADPPAVTCVSCHRAWRSATLAEGLRLLGRCPNCGGGLDFARPEAVAARPDPAVDDLRPPHLVLGLPRR